jgi:hypothetical protein
MHEPGYRFWLEWCNLYILLLGNLFLFKELSVCREVLNNEVLSFILFLKRCKDGLFLFVHLLFVLLVFLLIGWWRDRICFEFYWALFALLGFTLIEHFFEASLSDCLFFLGKAELLHFCNVSWLVFHPWFRMRVFNLFGHFRFFFVFYLTLIIAWVIYFLLFWFHGCINKCLF